MSSSVEQIKEKLSIEEIIGSYIKLERAGNNFKARCPFHNEKTPSFFVSPDRGSYYCFGCGVKGDIFTFVQEFESVDFIGALKILADRAGIQLEQFTQKTTDKKDKLYSLLEDTTNFLVKNLLNEDIPLEYLKKRGLTDKTIQDWRIGYVRDEWRSIYDFLKSKGYSDDEMLRAGMVKTENNSTYDRFRGRIMFPIFDTAGRVIAFSGRILHDDGKSAKYLNSPQTEVFDKSKTLYGLDKAKHSIRKFDFSILVEGQMDLLMSHQAGFTNTVASSGTTLTVEHLKLLKRISNKIIMSFDSDNAGAKAAERGWEIALSIGMEVKVFTIPKGFDPADLILKNRDAFKDVLKDSVHIIDFILNRVLEENTDERKIGIVINKKIIPYLLLIESNIERSQYVAKISKKTGIREESIYEDIKKEGRKLDDELKKIDQGEENQIINRDISSDRLKKGSVERSLASIILKKEENLQKELKEKIKDILNEEDFKKFELELLEKKDELIFEADAYYGSLDEGKMDKEINYLILSLKEEYFKNEVNQLLSDLKKAENDKNLDKIKSVSIRLNDLMKKIAGVKVEKNKIIN